jgi:hypothetical protein
MIVAMTTGHQPGLIDVGCRVGRKRPTLMKRARSREQRGLLGRAGGPGMVDNRADSRSWNDLENADHGRGPKSKADARLV